MEYSEFHGYKISKLTLGTVALGMNYGISNLHGQPALSDSFRVISTALNNGINTLDTARIYGNAEQLIGDFFKNNRVGQQPTLVSKFKISLQNIDNEEKACAEVYESVRTSTANLHLKKLPVCLFHSDRRLPLDPILEIVPRIMENLRNDEMIDVAGVSVDHPDEASYFLEHDIFDAFQVPLNLFDTRIIQNGMIEKMRAKGKIVFARSVFLQGLFFMEPDRLNAEFADAAVYLEKLHKIAQMSGLSIPQLAFSFVKDIKGITSIVFGAVTPEQVEQNIKLLATSPMKSEVRQLIQNNFDNVPEHIITPGLWSLNKTK